jgi:hypothetical protein
MKRRLVLSGTHVLMTLLAFNPSRMISTEEILAFVAREFKGDELLYLEVDDAMSKLVGSSWLPLENGYLFQDGHFFYVTDTARKFFAHELERTFSDDILLPFMEIADRLGK